MKRNTWINICLSIILLGLSAPLWGAGATFTDIALDPGSGLYHNDFSTGAALFDVNNDGYDDIILTNWYAPFRRLYLSNGDGTFSDIADQSGITNGGKTLGIATADLDGSGFMDFLLFYENSYEHGFLFMNNGDGTFYDADIEEFNYNDGYDGYAAAFADYDRDGLLDVFYGGRLFKNMGNYVFQNVNIAAGLGNLTFVAHAAFADIDNDLDPDLFIARQQGPASLYVNDGFGHFSNATGNIACDYLYGLCSSFGDIDSDGDLDLFVSYSNQMYINNGSGMFTLNTNCPTFHRYTRGSILADFDNDGDPDLVLANEDGSSSYFENLGGGQFEDRTAAVGMNNGQDKAMSVAIGDIEGDGDLDIYIGKTDYLINPCFVNNLNNNYAIDIIPRGVVSNFAGIGAKAYLYEGGHLGDAGHLISMHELTATSGFNTGTTGRIHLGTGSAGTFDLRVVFPSGLMADSAGVAAGSRVIMYESGEAPAYLYVAPGGATLSLDAEDPPHDMEFDITDSKDAGLAWTASTNDNWITLTTSSGMTPGTISATIDPGVLTIGSHHGSIVVEAPDAFNSPVTIGIHVTITDYFLNNVAADIGLNDYDFSFGAAFFDYDLDGFDDIFVQNNNGVCRLYHSDGGFFTDEASAAGVTPAYHNLGVFSGDLNDDNFPDILSFTEDREIGYAYLNSGFGTFVDAGIEEFATTLGYIGYAVNGADIDNDGDLDIFYGGRLFRNEGLMTYVDITAAAGLGDIPFVCNVTFGDIDNDGDEDLFVNRQNRRPVMLFRNDGTGHFEDISDNSNLGFFPTALGTTLGDIDGDGDLDAYTGAGYADPNKLYRNDGTGYFIDITAESGTGCTNYTRGPNFFDVDNDGDLDLVVANENKNSQLFLNDGTGNFADVTNAAGFNDGLAKAGPAVVGDYDADGDLDIYIGRTDNIRNSFFKNGTDNYQYIIVTPVGVASNKPAIGAKAYLYAAGGLGDPASLVGYREHMLGNSFNSSGPNYIHFGTGPGDLFDLRVIFPSGAVVDQPGVPAGSRLTVVESGEIPDYLVLIPGNFNFDFLAGDAPDQDELYIKNSTGNPIPWSATVADDWCTLNAYSGMTDQTVTLTVDPSDLDPGYYETTITITAEDAINSPRSAVVRMTIAPNQPVLALSTDSLYFVAEQNGFDPWTQNFSILNTGQGTLTWTLQTSGENWLSVFPQSGTAPTQVAVDCDIAGMPAGLYTATITVSSPEAMNSPAYLTVTFEILPGDVPERDTIRVASGAAQPGDHIVLPVYLHNMEEVAAFTVPLKYNPDVLRCDSVSFAGSRIEYINLLQVNIDSVAGQVLFGMVVFFEEYLQPGDGEVARLYMTVDPDAEEQVTTIDTAFFPPAGEFMIFDPASQAIEPEFVHSNIFVSLNMCGDANGSGMVDVSDAVYLVNYVFKGQRPPIPDQSGDANTDTEVNVGDIVYIIRYVFLGGPPPAYTKPTKTEAVYYTIERIIGDDGVDVRIRLDGNIPLGGAQFDIVDPAGFVTVTSMRQGDLASATDIHYGNSGQVHHFGLFSLDGPATIDAGDGELIRVRYQGFPDAPVRDLKVFDQMGHEVPMVMGLRPQSDQMPQFYSLSQNYPNPFNPTTTIDYALPAPAHVELTVYNVLGQTVKKLVDEDQKAGRYSIVWEGTGPDGDQVATGVYFYRLKTGDYTTSRKMILLK